MKIEDERDPRFLLPRRTLWWEGIYILKKILKITQIEIPHHFYNQVVCYELTIGSTRPREAPSPGGKLIEEDGCPTG